MAFGFNPKYTEDYSANDYTKPQYLILAKEAIEKLGWETSYLSNTIIEAYTDNGMFSRNAVITITIDNSIANINSASTGSEFFDMGLNKENVQNFIDEINQLKSVYTPEELDAKYEEVRNDLLSSDHDNEKIQSETTTGKIKGVVSVFIPKAGFAITPVLIDLNILIFIFMVASGVSIVSPDGESLLLWGANFKPLTLDGEWWRLLTSCFIHIGVIHLLMNIYALLYIGILLESRLGKGRFIAAYLLTGVAASTTSLGWHDLTISAGASGAIFGMYGVFLAMLSTNIIEKNERKALLTSIGIFVLYNLLNGVKAGIDNAAHIGGLISGLIIGFAFIPGLKQPDKLYYKSGAIMMMSVIVTVFTIVVCTNVTNDIGMYNAKMKEFAQNEEKAMHIFSMPEDASKEDQLHEISEVGIVYWKENIKLIDEADDYKLSAELYIRNGALKEYCELRIKSYELLYKAIDEDTDRYNDEIGTYTEKIAAIIDELSKVE